jgi:uroporphyrin-3 C-methyltransferase
VFIGVVLVLCLIGAISLWQRLGKIQSQLARQAQEANQTSQEAKLLARNATDASVQSTARLAVLEAKLNELIVQKAQVDEMLQSLSRSRVENQVLDIEAALISAQQQAQMTGSVQPLIAALMSAQQRMSRSPSPRLVPLENAIRRDLERLRGANVLDTPAVMVRIDELVRWADELPLSGAMQSKDTASGKVRKPPVKSSTAPSPTFWQAAISSLRQQWEDLVRVQKVEHPESALLSPDQAFFVRENLKLKFLNARMGVLARQYPSAKGDLAVARQTLERYFDLQSKSGQAALGGLDQALAQLSNGSLPGIDESLNAVAALTGRK